jgi:hypothetical protein
MIRRKEELTTQTVHESMLQEAMKLMLMHAWSHGLVGGSRTSLMPAGFLYAERIKQNEMRSNGSVSAYSKRDDI